MKAENSRGVSYIFGADVVGKFLAATNLDLVVRAHQVVENGYEFFADRQMVTVFSAPNYMGEFDNAGGILVVDETKTCSFKILKPDGPPLDASVFTPLWAPKADIAGPPEPMEPTEELSTETPGACEAN